MNAFTRDNAFSMRIPEADEWAAEIWCGWAGPNGSSYSRDDILGVRIGVTTREYTVYLPANLHDFRYRVIRRLAQFGKVLAPEADRLRLLADREHLSELRKALIELPRHVRPLGYAMAARRYLALRWFAGFAAKPRLEERYMAWEVIQ